MVCRRDRTCTRFDQDDVTIAGCHLNSKRRRAMLQLGSTISRSTASLYFEDHDDS